MDDLDGAFLCNHPQENPAVCPCDNDCYCRTRTCKNKSLKDARIVVEEQLAFFSGQEMGCTNEEAKLGKELRALMQLASDVGFTVTVKLTEEYAQVQVVELENRPGAGTFTSYNTVHDLTRSFNGARTLIVKNSEKVQEKIISKSQQAFKEVSKYLDDVRSGLVRTRVVPEYHGHGHTSIALVTERRDSPTAPWYAVKR